MMGTIVHTKNCHLNSNTTKCAGCRVLRTIEEPPHEVDGLSLLIMMTIWLDLPSWAESSETRTPMPCSYWVGSITPYWGSMMYKWLCLFVVCSRDGIFASYWGSPLVQLSEFNDFLWVCWFLCKNLSNFVYPVWKFHNPYCHNGYK